MDQRTADGEPLEDRGTAQTGQTRESDAKRSDDLQGDDDFEKTNAEEPPRTP